MKQCPKCGTPYGEGQAFCFSCGMYLKGNKAAKEGEIINPFQSGAEKSQAHGEEFQTPIAPDSHPLPTNPTTGLVHGPHFLKSSRTTAAWLALLLGPTGLHYFSMKKPVHGVLFLISLVISYFFSLPQIYLITGMIAFMQAIRLFCLSDEEYGEIYLSHL